MQRQELNDTSQKGILMRLLVYYYEVTQDFLRNTVLNGLKYLTFNYLTIWEKLFFVSCFLAAAYHSVNFAVTIREKWKTSPVITVMNPQATLITKEPFPAITICNMNQAQFSKVKDYKIDSVNYGLLQRLCFQELNYSAYAHLPEANNQTLANFIINNAQSCKHMVMHCEIGQTVRTCTDLFREVLLDEGLCCSFNVVHPFMLYKGEYYMIRDYTAIDGQSIPIAWTPESGYPKELPQSFYPGVASGDGVSEGLTLILNGDYYNYYCSSTNGPGLKVSFHNPIDTPHVKETGLSVALGYQTTFRIQANKDEAEKSLRLTTTPRQRQCYFTDEYNLLYYRYYTRRNCEMECDAHFMFDQCHCILYHMPLLWKNITICTIRHFNCVVQAEKDFEDPKRLECKQECLSGCNDLSFFPKAFYAAMDKDDFIINHPFLRNVSRKNLTSNIAFVKIFYPDNFYRSNIKSPYMGVTEFIYQTGGLMSIMMGFSVISIVELMYFFVMKPFIKLWKKIFYNSTVTVEEITSPVYYEIGGLYMVKIKPRYALPPDNLERHANNLNHIVL